MSTVLIIIVIAALRQSQFFCNHGQRRNEHNKLSGTRALKAIHPLFVRERGTQNVGSTTATCRRKLPSLLCSGHVDHTFRMSVHAIWACWSLSTLCNAPFIFQWPIKSSPTISNGSFFTPRRILCLDAYERPDFIALRAISIGSQHTLSSVDDP